MSVPIESWADGWLCLAGVCLVATETVFDECNPLSEPVVSDPGVLDLCCHCHCSDGADGDRSAADLELCTVSHGGPRLGDHCSWA